MIIEKSAAGTVGREVRAGGYKGSELPRRSHELGGAALG